VMSGEALLTSFTGMSWFPDFAQLVRKDELLN
jgi:hypothetical protein